MHQQHGTCPNLWQTLQLQLVAIDGSHIVQLVAVVQLLQPFKLQARGKQKNPSVPLSMMTHTHTHITYCCPLVPLLQLDTGQANHNDDGSSNEAAHQPDKFTHFPSPNWSLFLYLTLVIYHG